MAHDPVHQIALDVDDGVELDNRQSNIPLESAQRYHRLSDSICDRTHETTGSTTQSASILNSVLGFLRASCVTLQDRKKQSRFYGWQWGIFTGTITTAFVFTLNIIFIGIGLGHEHDAGVAVLFASNDMEKIARTNTAIHLLINVCSTLLLGASNYAMQVLTAPTRASCDRAHEAKISLDVGIMSITNLATVSPKRLWLYIALVVSSLPLHLFYNASVFQVVPDIEKKLITVNATSWKAPFLTGSLNDTLVREVAVAELAAPSVMALVLDLILIIDNVTIDIFNASGPYQHVIAASYDWSLETLLLKDPLHSYRDSQSWAHLPNNTGWLWLKDNESLTQSHRSNRPHRDLLHVQRAFTRTKPHWYRISLSLPLITIVTVANAIKLVVFVLILLDTSVDSPLVTIGDTISSFLSSPDPSTSAYRNFTLDDFVYEKLDAEKREKVDIKKILTKDQSVPGQWQPRVRQYGLSGKAHSLLHKDGLKYANLSVFVAMGAASLVLVMPLGPWGPASQQRSEFPSGVTGAGYISMALMINLPQFLLSTLYFAVNRLCTLFAVAYEYNQFGVQKKALRVSRPEGQQRGTYFLQLPLRFAIPLNVAGGLLHWLTSQTLFLVRIDQLRGNESRDIISSIAAFGVSGSAYLTLVIVLWLLLMTVLGVANTKFTERVPFAGTSSWVISAACHPPPNDKEPALQKVCWGRMPGEIKASDESEQFSFGSSAIILHLQNSDLEV